MIIAILDIIHFILSLTLLVVAIRSFLKTRIPAIFYLTLAFFLLTFGHLYTDIYFFHYLYLNKVASEIFDILGLTALIIAVIKGVD